MYAASGGGDALAPQLTTQCAGSVVATTVTQNARNGIAYFAKVAPACATSDKEKVFEDPG